MGRRWLGVLLACAPAIASANPEPRPRGLDGPVLHTRARAIATFGEGATVHVTWSPVPGAFRYHATWSAAGGKASDFWSKTPGFTQERVGSGTYTLRVTAVDEAGVEGPPSQPLTVEIVEVAATPPGVATPQPPKRGAYAVGTRFAVVGQSCTFGGKAMLGRVAGEPTVLRATTPGLVELRCGSADGGLVEPLVIAPVMASSIEAPLPRGQTTTVHVTVASVAQLGDALTVKPIGGATVAGELHRTPFGFDVPLAIAPDEEAVALAVIADGYELARVGFELVDPPPPKPPAPEPVSDAFALDFGAIVGAFVPTATDTNPHAPAIGHPTSYKDEVAAGPLFGLRMGLYLVPHVGIEAQGALLSLPTNMTQTGAFAWRASVALRTLESSVVGLRLYAGLGAITTLQDVNTAHASTSGEVHYGLGLGFALGTRSSLRLDGLDVVTTARDGGFAHNLELELGIVGRFGRRDRW